MTRSSSNLGFHNPCSHVIVSPRSESLISAISKASRIRSAGLLPDRIVQPVQQGRPILWTEQFIQPASQPVKLGGALIAVPRIQRPPYRKIRSIRLISDGSATRIRQGRLFILNSVGRILELLLGKAEGLVGMLFEFVWSSPCALGSIVQWETEAVMIGVREASSKITGGGP
jgi:hypothetical protein